MFKKPKTFVSFLADEEAEERKGGCHRSVRFFFALASIDKVAFFINVLIQNQTFVMTVVDTRTVQLLHVNPRKYKGRGCHPLRVFFSEF